MNLATPRLRLRKLCPDDVAHCYALDCDPPVREFIDANLPPASWPEYEAAHRAKIAGFARFGVAQGFWAAHLLDETFLGWFHLRPNEHWFPGELELGYRLHSRFWGRGLATEGALALIQHAFGTLEAPFVIATTLARNVPSRRVLEKAGLRWVQDFIVPAAEAPYWSAAERAAVKYTVHREAVSLR